jgi:hypothetical protein
MHSIGARDAASRKRTWPEATNETMAWVGEALTAIMWGRTGLAPVLAKQRAAAAPDRSITSGATFERRALFSRS